MLRLIGCLGVLILSIHTANPALAQKSCINIKNFTTQTVLNKDIAQPQIAHYMRRIQMDEDFRLLQKVSKDPTEDEAIISHARALGGLLKAGLSIEAKIYVQPRQLDLAGYQACPFITRAEVTFTYQPRIFVPNDYEKGSCRYNATLEHYLENISGHLEALSMIIDQFEQNMPATINFIEATPLNASQIDRTNPSNPFPIVQASFDTTAQKYFRQWQKSVEEYNAILNSDNKMKELRGKCARNQQ